MITLINHPGLKMVQGIQIQTPSPSIGLAYIGAAVRASGRDYCGIDACGENLDQIYEGDDPSILIQGLTPEEILARIPKQTTLFGFTCLFSHAWPLVADLGRRIRQAFPNALMVAGGEHPTALPQQALMSRVFDVVVMGEGEETFIDLIEHHEKAKDFKNISGIAYLNEKGDLVKNPARSRIKDIDHIPYPDWDSWSLPAYIDHHQVTGLNLATRSMPILGSRGCPYACTFCSNEHMWTRRYIFRDAKSLVDEMQFMKEKYGVDGFNFMDSTFVVSKAKIGRFCEALIERKLNISYQLPAGTRCEAIDENLAQLLEKSGLMNLALAPESGSTAIRKIIQKQVDLDDLFQAIAALKKTKITIGCFFVIGFPEETKATLRETLKLIYRLALAGVDDVTVSKFTPYPGTLYAERLSAEGLYDNRLEELKNVISFYSNEGRSYCKNLTFKEIHQTMNWMFMNFYILSFLLRPWRIVRNFFIYFSEGRENTRYMRFVSEILFLRRRWRTRRMATSK